METVTLDQQSLNIVPNTTASGAPDSPHTDALRAIEHHHRYLYASRFTKGRRVLDLSCEEGYGSAFLSLNAAEVVALSADESSMSLAKERYAKFSRVQYVVNESDKYVSADRKFDLIVCFGALEHLGKEARYRMMGNIKQSLKPDGVLMISSPIRREGPVPSNDQGQGVYNMSAIEFATFLREYYGSCVYVGQKAVTVSSIWSLYQWKDDLFRFHTRENLFTPPSEEEQFTDPAHLIAVCSDEKLSREIADSSQSFYYDTRKIVPAEELAYRTRELELELEESHTLAQQWESDRSTHTAQLTTLRGEFATAEEKVEEWKQTVAARDRLIATLERDLDDSHTAMDALQQAYDLRTVRSNALKEEHMLSLATITNLQAKLEEQMRRSDEMSGEATTNLEATAEVQRQLEERTLEVQLYAEEKEHFTTLIAELREAAHLHAETAQQQATEMESLRSTIADQHARVDESMHAVASVEVELQLRIDEVREMRLQMEEANDLAETYANENISLRERAETLQHFQDSHEASLEAARRESTEFRRSAEEFEQQYTAQTESALSSQQEAESLRSVVGKLTSELEVTKEAMTRRTNELEEFEEQFMAQSEIASDSQQEANTLRTAVAELRSELDAVHLASTRLSHEVEEKRSAVAFMQAEHDGHTDVVAKYEKQVKDQTEFLRNLQRECDTHAMAARMAKIDLEKQVAAFDTYQKTQADLQMRYSKSQIKVQEMQASLAMAEQKLQRVISSSTYKMMSSMGLAPKENL